MTHGGDGGSEGPDDLALLDAHRAGDPDAFGELFRRHRDRLWAVALRTTGNPEDAADALQDALISAFRRADSFRGESAVTTWLHRVVVNACLDRLRRRKVRAADALPDDLEEYSRRGAVLSAEGAGERSGRSGAGTESGSSGPEAQVLAAERRERIRVALDELPPDQRAALVLVDLEGYPVAEAAAVLEVPVGTVKSRCARGRARLAVLLADLVAAPDDGPHAGSAAGSGAASAAGSGASSDRGPGTSRAPAASHRGEPATAPGERDRRARPGDPRPDQQPDPQPGPQPGPQRRPGKRPRRPPRERPGGRTRRPDGCPARDDPARR